MAWIQKNRRQQRLLINIIILILTATVFFYSPNLWLLWPVHLAMVVMVKKIGAGEHPPEIMRSPTVTPQ
jgi:hypothetical protein